MGAFSPTMENRKYFSMTLGLWAGVFVVLHIIGACCATFVGLWDSDYSLITTVWFQWMSAAGIILITASAGIVLILTGSAFGVKAGVALALVQVFTMLLLTCRWWWNSFSWNPTWWSLCINTLLVSITFMGFLGLGG